MRWRLGVLAILATSAAGCAPSIGDSCNGSLDCSVNGDRTCDRGRPNGACTVYGCEPDTCPDDSVCVRWRPDPSRLSFTACMRRCEDDGSCRVDEGYHCRSACEVQPVEPESGPPDCAEETAIAEVVDDDWMEMDEPEPRFCVAVEPTID
ncbi:MAG TPA: hypothetical protein RMH99_19445 [Sandaracinaceae bacterium LLY-WYZ-13_1]|nr:hypothetical protein [Sandaracinaceae bacterium LLY-WYZ-13_1]